jgi:hypothetical protein
VSTNLMLFKWICDLIFLEPLSDEHQLYVGPGTGAILKSKIKNEQFFNLLES